MGITADREAELLAQVPTGIPQASISGLVPALALKADLVNGKLATSQIPALSTQDPQVVDNRAALLALTFTDTAELAGSIIPASGWFLLFFLVGFLILASLWAMIGSMASRSEDLNNSSGPVLTIIIVALFAGLFAKGQLLVVASYVPVISTVAMPVRMLSAEVPLWETLLSLAVALAAAYALLRFGERIYRRAVMQSGGALTLRKAMKLEA